MTLEEIQDWMKKSCNRYVNGQCSNRACLMRGGAYKAGSPPDYSTATCDEHEAVIEIERAIKEIERLRAAIGKHHNQKADDRCIEDDDALYAAAGLPPCDRHVGDKAAMLKNCARFIERRCEAGKWPTYAELEKEIADLKGLRSAAEAEWLRKNSDNP